MIRPRYITPIDLKIPYGLTKADAEADAVFHQYLDLFGKKTGLERDQILALSLFSGALFELEFTYSQAKTWETSLCYFPRSICFGRNQIDQRWQTLEDIDLQGPILDYGCGAGFLAAYLKVKTGHRVYAYDTPGNQASLAKEFLTEFDVDWHEEGNHYGTILCYNVLEHIADPVAEVYRMRSMCDHLYTNIGLSGEKADIADLAPETEVEKVVKMCYAAGELLPLDGCNTVEEGYSRILGLSTEATSR